MLTKYIQSYLTVKIASRCRIAGDRSVWILRYLAINVSDLQIHVLKDR